MPLIQLYLEVNCGGADFEPYGNGLPSCYSNAAMRLLPLAFALLPVLLLPSCAPRDGDYPSLTLRNAERAGADRTPSTDGLALVDTAPPSPAVQAEIDKAAAAAQAAHRRFLTALPAARRAVAAGANASVENEAYAAAQIALGNLQTIRSETVFALADLDALLAARSNALLSAAEVRATRETVAALLQEENAAVEALERALR